MVLTSISASVSGIVLGNISLSVSGNVLPNVSEYEPEYKYSRTKIF